MRYYFIVGEASGDLHASNLMRGLRACDPACEFRTFRGTSVMGVVEVLSRLGTVFGDLASCRKDLLAWKPDAVILVDYPGFNLRMARFARRHGFKVFYYIAPKVWAHRAGRVRRLRRDVDALYCIFPFELEWFRAHGIAPRYFGNPLSDSIAQWDFRPMEGLRIALLPGSRPAELSFLMPRFVALERLLAADPRFAGYRLTVAAAPSLTVQDYRKYLPDGSRIEVVAGRTYDVLASAKAAVISSGTASLEAALIGTPQVVCYGFNRLTWLIARLSVKVRYVSLANLTLDRLLFPELLQDAASPERIFSELEKILTDGETAARMRAGYDELKTLLGGVGASGRIAKDIYGQITRV